MLAGERRPQAVVDHRVDDLGVAEVLPQRTLGRTYGALVIDSMPPATAVSSSPSRISWSA